MFDFDEIAEPEAAEEKADPEAVAREAAESLRDAAWQVRFGACRTLESMGAAAAPHAKILARVAAKDKEPDVRKAAQGVLNSLRSSGVALPADYLDDYADDGEDKARNEKKKQREEAWAERRKQREKEWEEKQKLLEEEDRREEARRRREDQLIYEQYQYYPEEPSQPTPSMPTASSFPSAAGPSPAAPSAYGRGRSRPSAFGDFKPPEEFNPKIIHPAYAPPQEDQEFEYLPEDDFEEREAEERQEREKEVQQKQEQLDEKRRLRAEMVETTPGEVPWEGPRANFRVFGEILSMRLEREEITPLEIGEIWEKRWGIPYATNIKFEAPEESSRKFMHPREDHVPLHPAVVVLQAKTGGILTSLATACREYGGLLPEEAEAVRLGKLQQSLAAVEKRQKANARERERLHVKETRARLKTGTYQERQDRRVMEMRGIVHQALGVSSANAGTTESGRPVRGMRELKRSTLS